MSVINNHVCDNCGKAGISKEEYSMPGGWYSVNIYEEGKHRNEGYEAEGCCKECLMALLDKWKGL
jgi:hypothetical protein